MLPLLPFGFIVLLASRIGATDDQAPDFSVLNNDNGTTPCEMADKLRTPCLNVYTTGRSKLDPPQTLCTCNTAFFNIWSACLASTNNILPRFDDWQDECQERSIVVTEDYPMNTLPGYDIPSWARIRVLSGSNFGVQITTRALPENDGGWTPIQILTPIIVGLTLMTIFAALLLLYWRKSSLNIHKESWMGGHLRRPRRWFGRVYKVSEADRGSTWTIDHYDELEAVGSSSPRRPRRGHVRLSSESSPPHSITQIKLPGFSTHEHNPAPRGRDWQTSAWLRDKVGKVKDVFPTPWKKKPVPVMSLPPKRGFRIDDRDLSTQATLSRRSTVEEERYSWKYIPEPMGNRDLGQENEMLFGADNEEDDDDSESDNDTAGPEGDSEETSLISPARNGGGTGSVVLISRLPGVDFTVESGDSQPQPQGQTQGQSQTQTAVRIIPPSPIPSPEPLPPPSKPVQQQPEFPPAPKYPAPVPSTSPWRSPPHLRKTTDEDGVHSLPPSSTHPSLETLRRAPSSSHSHRAAAEQPAYPSTSSNARKAPAESLRRSPAHIRRPSADNMPSSPPRARRPLGDDIRRVPSHSRRPTPGEPPHSAPLLDRPTLEPLRRAPSPSRSLSADSVMPFDPPLPSQSSVENLSRQPHSRSLSSDSVPGVRPLRTDPVMLFPGAVRSAGYMPSVHSRNPSSESVYSTASWYPHTPPAVHSNAQA